MPRPYVTSAPLRQQSRFCREYQSPEAHHRERVAELARLISRASFGLISAAQVSQIANEMADYADDVEHRTKDEAQSRGWSQGYHYAMES